MRVILVAKVVVDFLTTVNNAPVGVGRKNRFVLLTWAPANYAWIVDRRESI
jgi:hypothetical protein